MIIKFFQIDPKKINDDVFLRKSVNVFSEGRRQEKCVSSAYVHQCKMIKFNFEGCQQDESTCHWHDPPVGWAGAPPMCRPPFPPGSEKSDVTSKSSFKSGGNRAASSL